MKKIYYLLTMMLLVFSNTMAQQIPGEVQEETISIIGATLHIGDGTLVENGSLVFENGKIIAIGSSADVEARGAIINAEGKHVYPGFIIPNSSLGLGEIGAVKATMDADEIGTFLPHIRSLIAYNAESKVVESMRPNGVLIAQITPRGGAISGTSSIVQLDAWNWEDAAVKTDDGIHINWPNSLKSKYEGFGRVVTSGKNEAYDQKVIDLTNFLTGAQAYGKAASKKENIPFAATQGLFNGNQKVYIHVKRVKEIMDAISLMQTLGISNTTIVGAEEAYKIIDYLKSNHISVLLKRTHSLPDNNDDDYDLPYKNAVLLAKGGILVGLENSGDGERMNGRNLPFYAGTTTGFGLNSEEALTLITLNTAKILGIAENYGSLKKGKSATLFISEGNALDMRGNILTKAFIDGRKISLETHQTDLWKKYMDKYSKAE